MLKRLLSSAPAGLAVTLVLLLSMQRLLALDLPTLPPRSTDPLPVWIASAQVIEAVAIDDLWELPPSLTPPSASSPSDTDTSGFGALALGHLRLAEQPLPPLGDDLSVLPDGALVRLVAVEPTYPPVAQRRGLEGAVTVRFDVTANGDVDNVEVMESSHGVFEASALRAARKFRFKPRVVDGVAQRSAGVVYRFQFRMED